MIVKLELDFSNGTGRCIVTKDSNHKKKYNGSGYALAESTFLYDVLQILKSLGHDVIKKRMHKDGHLVDDTQQYIRTRSWCGQDNEFAIFNGDYAIYDLGEKFNELSVGESVSLSVII